MNRSTPGTAALADEDDRDDICEEIDGVASEFKGGRAGTCRISPADPPSATPLVPLALLALSVLLRRR